MTKSRMGLLGLPSLLAALGGCTAPPAEGGGPEPALAESAIAPAAPGPGWLLLGVYSEGAVYMHPRSTRRVGTSAFIILVATKRQPAVLPGGVTVGSLKERIEIDCARVRFRRHDGTVHPDQVAAGPVLGRVGLDRWKDAVPGSVMGTVSLAVCAASALDVPPAPSEPRFPKNRVKTFRT